MARVNQEATNKIIQELIAEKEKLLRELENEKGKGGYTDDDITRLREEQEREVSCVAPDVNNTKYIPWWRHKFEIVSW